MLHAIQGWESQFTKFLYVLKTVVFSGQAVLLLQVAGLLKQDFKNGNKVMGRFVG